MLMRMLSEDSVRPLEGMRFGHSRRERAALGLPMDPERERARMAAVEGKYRRAEVKCVPHDRIVGVLTDTRLITRNADVAYPHESEDVMAACPVCTASGGPAWWIDVKRLREIKIALNAEADRMRKAGGKPREIPDVDVRQVCPDWLLQELSSTP